MATTPDTDGLWVGLARCGRFSASALAASLGISLRQLERVFLEDAGCTPDVWLHHARMWAACPLLLERRSPKEFCEELGFTLPDAFYRSFKRYHEWSVRQYVTLHERVDSASYRRLAEHARTGPLLPRPRTVPQHVTALTTLNELLLRSERLTYYRNSSAWRAKAADVAQQQ